MRGDDEWVRASRDSLLSVAAAENTASGTELGLTASLPTGRSRAETREATGLQTGWRGSLILC